MSLLFNLAKLNSVTIITNSEESNKPENISIDEEIARQIFFINKL